MKVFLSTRARKALDDSPAEIRTGLESKISELLDSAYPSGCKKLKGAPNAYRLRAGDYRILYQILNREEVLVFKISTRSTAYG